MPIALEAKIRQIERRNKRMEPRTVICFNEEDNEFK
jgi:hypothetical protein